MKRKITQNFVAAGSLFVLFLIFTILVLNVDVQPVGCKNTKIGFASMNVWAAKKIGQHMFLYKLTEALGILALAVAAFFGMLGLFQLITRKNLKKVESSLYVLAGFYVLVACFYLLFEKIVINYRPVILDEGLEASYPSSHTMLAACILVTAMMQFNKRIKNVTVRKTVLAVLAVLAAVIVVGRLLSGVHWLTDIIGALILSAALILLYYAVIEYVIWNNMRKRKLSKNKENSRNGMK